MIHKAPIHLVRWLSAAFLPLGCGIALICMGLWIGHASAQDAAEENEAMVAVLPEVLAEQTVSRLETALIDSMKRGEDEPYQVRRRALSPVVDRVLNFERMGRFIFGSQWRAFSDTDRKAFIQAFRNLSTSTYAARFKRYQGERFERQKVDVQGQRRALVRSHFIKKSGTPVAFDYLLIHSDDEWKIVNIIVDGVSDLALKRTQYSGIFADLGMSGVIETMAGQENLLENE